MASVKTQMTFWGAALLFFFTFLWVFKGVLAPFVLGIAIAYLLNPLVRLLDKIKIRRWLASLLILFLFIVFVTAALVFILPPVYREITQLIWKLPDYVDAAIAFAMPYFETFQEKFGFGGFDQLAELAKSNVGKIFTAGTKLLAGLANGGQAFASFLTMVVLTPIVAFFTMKEWPNMVAYVENLYPQRHEKTIKSLLSQIDRKIAGFVRGQLTVAFVLGLIYATVLSFAGLNYGFLIGICAGIAGIVPLVGSTLGLIVSVVVAWLQSGDIVFTGGIAAVFIAGQILEANVLTPKLIGDSVGMHPLWIIFSLMAGGSLFGITGMLLAVPVAASAGVLISYAVSLYKKSNLYKNPGASPKEKTA